MMNREEGKTRLIQTPPASTTKLKPPRKKSAYEHYRSIDAPWLGNAMLLGMKVWTDEELAAHAKVSVDQVRTWIRAGLPTLPTTDGAIRISEAVFDDWAKSFQTHDLHGRTYRTGRKDETSEIAKYVCELRQQEKSWKDILKACKERWPNDSRVRTKEQLRGTLRRHFPKFGLNTD